MTELLNIWKDFVLMSKRELELRPKEIIFDLVDTKHLISQKDFFIKFLEKLFTNYQLELTSWKYRWQEEKIYRSLETINEIINSLNSLEKTYNLTISKIIEEEKKINDTEK